ncbi:MAG TPA: FkbM family methyltransferase [Pirellulales bacterium]|jgi:FkbM family methyltransferase|nr:FkbM family methyltransferase [Pirellulales bacterium]
MSNSTAAPASPPADYTLDLEPGLKLYLSSKQQIGAAKYVVKEIFEQRRYARPGFEIKPTDTIVDVGANIGVFSLWAARQAPQGKVLAIEPTSVIDVLKLNLEKNGITNVIAAKEAAGEDGQSWDMVTYPGFNIVNHRAAWRPKLFTRFVIKLLFWKYQSDPVIEKVHVKSLERLLDENGIERVNYFKIDCEGGEYEIFRNLSNRGFDRLDKIVMEFHEYTAGQDHRELVKMLKDHGFEMEIHKNFLEYHFMKYGVLWAWRP